MKIETKDGTSPSVLLEGSFKHFKNGVTDLSGRDAVSLLTSNLSQYQRANNDKFPFSKDSWEKEKRVVYETTLTPANGFGKAGTYITKGLSQYCDVSIIDPLIHTREQSEIDKACLDLAYKPLDKIDSFYIQSKVISGIEGHDYSDAQIIRTMFETNKIRKSWAKYMNHNMLAVLVPCETQRQVFKSSGVNIPIYVLPDAVDIDAYPQAPLSDDDKFFFGTEGSLTYRKGTDITVKAFQKAFPKERCPNVFLYIKTREKIGLPFGEDNKIVNGRVIINNDDRIIVISEKFSHKQLIEDFYHKLNAYVFLSRGEGFSLTTAQAMAMGIPIVGSDCSGVREQISDERGYKVKTSLVPVPDNKMYTPKGLVDIVPGEPACGYNPSSQVEGHQWWQADLDDAVEKMLEVYNDYKEAKNRAQKAKRFAIKNYSSKAVGKQLYNILNDIYDNSK